LRNLSSPLEAGAVTVVSFLYFASLSGRCMLPVDQNNLLKTNYD
jgi:hypothetical protein